MFRRNGFVQSQFDSVPDTPQITELLIAWKRGDESAFEDLCPVLGRELRRIAHKYMRHLLKAITLPEPGTRWSDGTVTISPCCSQKENWGATNLWRQRFTETTHSRVTNFNEDLLLHYDQVLEANTIIVSR
jgi:hypothetical protein